MRLKIIRRRVACTVAPRCRSTFHPHFVPSAGPDRGRISTLKRLRPLPIHLFGFLHNGASLGHHGARVPSSLRACRGPSVGYDRPHT